VQIQEPVLLTLMTVLTSAAIGLNGTPADEKCLAIHREACIASIYLGLRKLRVRNLECHHDSAVYRCACAAVLV